MSKIITTTIKAPKCAHHHRGRKPTRQERAQAEAEQDARTFARWKRAEERKARAVKQLTVRSDGVTRCSKCPPKTCCEDCRRINNARQVAGLIRPRGDPRPHPNNCMPCIPHTPGYLGRRPEPPLKSPNCEVVSIEVKPLGGGWYLGQALLGLNVVYEKKFRSRAEARTYAVNSMVDIREGLRFEQLVNG